MQHTSALIHTCSLVGWRQNPQKLSSVEEMSYYMVTGTCKWRNRQIPPPAPPNTTPTRQILVQYFLQVLEFPKFLLKRTVALLQFPQFCSIGPAAGGSKTASIFYFSLSFPSQHPVNTTKAVLKICMPHNLFPYIFISIFNTTNNHLQVYNSFSFTNEEVIHLSSAFPCICMKPIFWKGGKHRQLLFLST